MSQFILRLITEQITTNACSCSISICLALSSLILVWEDCYIWALCRGLSVDMLKFSGCYKVLSLISERFVAKYLSVGQRVVYTEPYGSCWNSFKHEGKRNSVHGCHFIIAIFVQRVIAYIHFNTRKRIFALGKRSKKYLYHDHLICTATAWVITYHRSLKTA